MIDVGLSSEVELVPRLDVFLFMKALVRAALKNPSRRAVRVFVDDLATNMHYLNRMRRMWLTVLTAFALVASGVANAQAAPLCPMQAAASGAAHDCCDDEGPMGAPNEDSSEKMTGCVVGMACRTAPAVAPALAPMRMPATALIISESILGEQAPPGGPLQELFRPPRTI